MLVVFTNLCVYEDNFMDLHNDFYATLATHTVYLLEWSPSLPDMGIYARRDDAPFKWKEYSWSVTCHLWWLIACFCSKSALYTSTSENMTRDRQRPYMCLAIYAEFGSSLPFYLRVSLPCAIPFSHHNGYSAFVISRGHYSLKVLPKGIP